jgi:hypothetical protein
MDDDSAKKKDWAIIFLFRLCLIGWAGAILYETFAFAPIIRQLCLLFGPWACVIALVHSVSLLLIRRQGIFFIFALVIIPPTYHFGLVLRNIVEQKKLFVSDESVKRTDSESKDAGSQQKSSP